MKTFLTRIRGVLGMGLTWAVGWALAGILIGIASILLPWLPWHLFFDVFDAPLPALAIPGFVGGTLFSGVLGVAARRRRFDELSLPRFVAWGALGGMLLSLVPAAMVTLGLASVNPGAGGLWQLTAAICVPLTLLSAASAAGTLALARAAEGRALPRGHEAAEEAGLTAAPAATDPHLPGGPDPSPQRSSSQRTPNRYRDGASKR